MVADQVGQLIVPAQRFLPERSQPIFVDRLHLALLARQPLGHLHWLGLLPELRVPVLTQRGILSHYLGAGPRRHLALDFLPHLGVCQLNLLGHELLRFGVQLGLHFLFDLLPLDHLGNLFVILGPDDLQLLLQLFLSRILLRDSGLCRLKLRLNLFCFGHLMQLQRPTTALSQQMRGDGPREQDWLVLAQLLLDFFRDARLGHELGVEDFVLALGQVGHDLDQVLLVREVGLGEVDAALQAQSGEVLLHLGG